MNRRNDSGASAVELAILLPLLMAILFGTIEYGTYFFMRMTLSQAAREGVRVGALYGTVAQANARATTAANPLGGLVFPNTVVCAAGDVTGNATVAVQHVVNFPFPLPGLGAAAVLRETAVMRCGI
jgi:Flp pilus assembly protein TadG